MNIQAWNKREQKFDDLEKVVRESEMERIQTLVTKNHRHETDTHVFAEVSYKIKTETEKKKILGKRVKGMIRDGLAQRIEEKVTTLIASGAIDISNWNPDTRGFILPREVAGAILLDLSADIVCTPQEGIKAKNLMRFL